MKFCMKCMAQYHDSAKICPSCGYQEGSPQTGSGLQIGSGLGTVLNTEPAVNRYLVGCVCAEHSRSLDYIGFDRFLQCRVLIEEYYPNDLVCRSSDGISVQTVDGSQQSAFRKGKQRFLYETRRLVPYMYRDCMLKIIDVFAANNTVYAVRKLEDGETVESRVSRSPFREKDAVSYMNTLLNFLSGLHADGLLIGALHPQKLLVSERGCLVITDCSQITKIGEQNELLAKAEQNPYMAPETASGNLSPASDVYAAGAVLYKMLTGLDPKLPAERSETDEEEQMKLQRRQISEITGTAMLNAMRVRVSAGRTPNAADFYKELNGQGATRASARIMPKIPQKSDSGGWKRWHKIAIACAAAIVAAACGFGIYGMIRGGTPFYVFSPESGKAQVPDVTGQTDTDAQKMTLDAGLIPLIVNGNYSDTVERGRIVNQDIAPGKRVDPDTTLEMTMSLGPELTELPDVTGLEQSEAESILTANGFTVKVTEESSNTAPGLIIRQSPETGLCARNAEIEIVVSTGKDFDPTKTDQIGNYVGKSYADIEKLLDEKDIYVKKVMQESDEAEGTILAQDIEAGQVVHHGKTITLTVSSGKKKYTVKDYMAWTYADAYAELTGMGFTVKYEYAENTLYARDVVIGQSVTAGTVTDNPRSITITLTISDGGQKNAHNEPPQTAAATKATTRATTVTTTAAASVTTGTTTSESVTETTTTAAADTEPPADETTSAATEAPKKEFPLQWSLNGSELSISGSGAMPNDWAEEDFPWYAQREQIATIIISDGVYSIGKNAFYGCTNLTRVTIEGSIEWVGAQAFAYCTGLADVISKEMMHSQWKGIIEAPNWQFLSDSSKITIQCADGDYKYKEINK